MGTLVMVIASIGAGKPAQVGRAGLAMKLEIPAIAKELKLTEAQRAEVRKVAAVAMQKARKAADEYNASEEGQAAKKVRKEALAQAGPLAPQVDIAGMSHPLRPYIDEVDAAARRVLTTAQWNRLLQIDLQRRSWPALADPDLVAVLNIDDDAVEFIRGLKAERAQLGEVLAAEGNTPTKSYEAMKAQFNGALGHYHDADEKLGQKALRLLTKKQRAKYKAMLGEPFAGLEDRAPLK